MKKIVFLVFAVPLLILIAVARSFAAADFYGVKMTSEYYAKNLALDESGDTPRFPKGSPGLDERVVAYGSLTGSLRVAKGIKIQVFNHSDETINGHYDTAEYTVITKDGERHSLVTPPSIAFSSSDSIIPNKSVVFQPLFDDEVIRKEDIRLIICSFDLGDVKIILLPLSKHFEIVKPAINASQVKPASPKKARVTPPSPPAPKTQTPSPKKPFSFGQWLKPASAPKPAVPAKPAPVVVKPAKKVLLKSSDMENNWFENLAQARPSGQSPRVEKVDQNSGLLVVSMGSEDGLKKDSIISVVRNGALIGRALARNLKSGYSIAHVIPDEAQGNIQVGDDVVFFDLAG